MFGRTRSRRRGFGGALGTVVAMAVGVVAPVAMAAPASAASVAPDSAFTLDGGQDAAYAQYGTSATVQTVADTKPRAFLSRVTVAETTNYWYVYEQQPSNVKTASYCAKKTNTASCYQSWNDLVGSDYMAISFTAGGTAREVHADALFDGTSLHAANTWTSGFGADCKECKLTGFTTSDVDAATSYDYNYNVVGWTDIVNSPDNVAGSNAPGYIYESAAEYRIAKSALPVGFTLTPQTMSYTLHDSPSAPSAAVVNDRYVNCAVQNATINVGDTATVLVDASLNGAPALGAVIQGRLSDTTVGTLGTNPQPTNANGVATFTVHGDAVGTTNFHAYWDGNNNGMRESDEPTTPQVCSITVSPAQVTQSLEGHIYECVGGPNGTQGTTEITNPAGTLTTTGPNGAVAGLTGANPQGPKNVDTGDYTMTASVPSASWQLVQCGTGHAADSATVTVPSGGHKVINFYVVPVPPPAQSLEGHIYECVGGPNGTQGTVEITNPRGTLATTGPTGAVANLSGQNPQGPRDVAVGDYTMAASVDTNSWQLVACGTGHAADSATVTVPSGGHEVINFYVVPVAIPTQSLEGHIYECVGGPNGSQGTVEITNPRGTLATTGPTGAVANLSGQNPQGPRDVAVGDYTMAASVDTNSWQLVACGSGHPAGSATVTVPSGGHEVINFYVVPVAIPTQSLEGHIYECVGGPNGSQGTVEITNPRGALATTGPTGAVANLSGQNPQGPRDVAVGDYTMTASVPAADWQLVTCGSGHPAGSATVTVPSGGHEVINFYVVPVVVPTQTLAGHLYDCVGNQVSTTLHNGGTIAASGPTTIPATQDQLASTPVDAGTYTMTATAPAGYRLVSCGVNPTPGSVTVVVPSGGHGEGRFYVENIPAITLNVTKTNDADLDGAFHDAETAPEPGSAVTFQVSVVNTSAVPVVIDSITDAYPIVATGSPVTCLVGGTTDVVGTVLAASGQPGSSVTCRFTVDGYAPAADSSLTDLVKVGGHEKDVPDNKGEAQDTSVVLSPPPANPGSPDLAILKVASADLVHPGDNLTYTLTVSNVGDAATTGEVRVTDAIPDKLTPLSVSGTSWDCTIDGQDLTCLWLGAAVQPGDTLPGITVSTRVRASAAGTVINTGIVKTPGDINPTNDTSTVKTPIVKVLPEKIVQPTVNPPSVLPFTGTAAAGLIPYASGMILIGLLLMVGATRRSRPRPECA